MLYKSIDMGWDGNFSKQEQKRWAVISRRVPALVEGKLSLLSMSWLQQEAGRCVLTWKDTQDES